MCHLFAYREAAHCPGPDDPHPGGHPHVARSPGALRLSCAPQVETPGTKLPAQGPLQRWKCLDRCCESLWLTTPVCLSGVQAPPGHAGKGGEGDHWQPAEGAGAGGLRGLFGGPRWASVERVSTYQGWTPPTGPRGVSVFSLEFRGGFVDTLGKRFFSVPKSRAEGGSPD